MSDHLLLNVGCGPDVRNGWVNIDPWWPAPGVKTGDARDLSAYRGRCALVLLNHVLHLFTYDEADQVLDQCVAALESGGRLVVVEADVLGAIDTWLTSGDLPWLYQVISDEVEPDPQGKLLRWACWHGTRRSLWSWDSLTSHMERAGLDTSVPVSARDDGEWMGARAGESFVAIGHRP